jgi:hypothetical protein
MRPQGELPFDDAKGPMSGHGQYPRLIWKSPGVFSRATKLGYCSDMAEIDALSLAVYVSGSG